MQDDFPTDAGDDWQHPFTFAVRDAAGQVINTATGSARGPFGIWDMPSNGYAPGCKHRISIILLPAGMSLAHGDSGAQAHRLIDLLWPHRDTLRNIATTVLPAHERAALRLAVENHMADCGFSRRCAG